MTIDFFSKTCEDCTGNHALASMKAHCKRKGVDFREKRTILFKLWEDEANQIMELNPGLELPFFYGESSGEVLPGFSLTPLDTLDKLIKAELESEK